MSFKTIRPALLVVDVQNDFCPGGALAVSGGDQVVAPLNQVISFFEKKRWPLFFSQDWHPQYTKHFIPYGGLWPVHCVRGTKGANFHPDLHLPLAAYLVEKGTSGEDDGYSPFEGRIWEHASNLWLTLNKVLAQNKVTMIWVGGLATDYCVKAACLDARKLGYQTFLITNACRAVNLKPTDENEALQEMRQAGVIFSTSDALSKILCEIR